MPLDIRPESIGSHHHRPGQEERILPKKTPTARPRPGGLNPKPRRSRRGTPGVPNSTEQLMGRLSNGLHSYSPFEIQGEMLADPLSDRPWLNVTLFAAGGRSLRPPCFPIPVAVWCNHPVRSCIQCHGRRGASAACAFAKVARCCRRSTWTLAASLVCSEAKT